MSEFRLQAVAPPATQDEPMSPTATRPPGYWWAWQPLHGGTGVTTLARAVTPKGGGYVFGHDDAGHERWPTLPVVAVVRDHARGLEHAQTFAGFVDERPEWRVLGLVIIPARDRALPKVLEDRLQVVRGGYAKPRTTIDGVVYQPKVWRMPWVESWFVGAEPSSLSTPNEYRSLVREIAEAAGAPLAL